MQKEKKITVGQWCGHWFQTNRSKWNGNTEGGYRNLIYSHILPGVGGIELTALTEQTVSGFYDDLRCQGLSARSVWCVHLLLRRCLDEVAWEQLIPYNPVRLCPEPAAEEYKTAPLHLGQNCISRLIESVSLRLMYMVFFVGGHDSLIFLWVIIFTVQCNNSVNVRL